jgi:hypothetical protein
MDQDRGFWRANLWRRAPEAGAAAKPIVDMAQGSRRTRKSRGAASSPVEIKSSDGEGADGLASRVSEQLDPLDVDILEQVCRLSGRTFGDITVKAGLLL